MALKQHCITFDGSSIKGAEAIKTPDFALSEWFDEQGEVKARMLFDHRPENDWDQGYGYQFWRSRHG